MMQAFFGSKPVGTSLNVIVTVVLLFVSLSAVASNATLAVGLTVSMLTVAAPPAPRLTTASVYWSSASVTEPVPSKSSSAVNVAVHTLPETSNTPPLN